MALALASHLFLFCFCFFFLYHYLFLVLTIHLSTTFPHYRCKIMQPDGSLDAPAAAHRREARARVQPKLTNRHDRAFGSPKKNISTRFSHLYVRKHVFFLVPFFIDFFFLFNSFLRPEVYWPSMHPQHQQLFNKFFSDFYLLLENVDLCSILSVS